MSARGKRLDALEQAAGSGSDYDRVIVCSGDASMEEVNAEHSVKPGERVFYIRLVGVPRSPDGLVKPSSAMSQKAWGV